MNFDEFSIQFEKISTEQSSGIFGKTDYDLISVSRIEFGPIVNNDIVINRAKKGELDRKLLGIDLLTDYCLHFSFQRGRINVNTPPLQRIQVTQDLILDIWVHSLHKIEMGPL